MCYFFALEVIKDVEDGIFIDFLLNSRTEFSYVVGLSKSHLAKATEVDFLHPKLAGGSCL